MLIAGKLWEMSMEVTFHQVLNYCEFMFCVARILIISSFLFFSL
jgi:hypothetical protein